MAAGPVMAAGAGRVRRQRPMRRGEGAVAHGGFCALMPRCGCGGHIMKPVIVPHPRHAASQCLVMNALLRTALGPALLLTAAAGAAAVPLPPDLMARAVSDVAQFDPRDREAAGPDGLGLLSARRARGLVDQVVVSKSHKQMTLLKDGHEVRRYWIALSDRPRGHKQREGDRRTPEGTYYLDYVKENSTYYRAFHISYPNEQDVARARSRGYRPGGMIMVHGQPGSGAETGVQRSDWTNGCIALLNYEMDEFIALVDPGTPITIRP